MIRVFRKLLVPSLGVAMLATVASCSSPAAPNQTDEAKDEPSEEGNQSLMVPSREGNAPQVELAFADSFVQRA